MRFLLLMLLACRAFCAVIFLEPGGDATFDFQLWNSAQLGVPAIATDFVHGGHVKSIKYRTANADAVRQLGVVADAGARISFYLFPNALPSATGTVLAIFQSGSTSNSVIRLRITSAGVLQAWNNTAQIGSNGPTLSTSAWTRLSLAYTVTSTSVNRIEVFKDAVSAISITNATLSFATSADIMIGNISGNSTADYRTSDHYVDNSSALTDPGNIWVTAKRPFSNGTNVAFTTQIGSGGSGYGSGHTPQENERPQSDTNGWSIINSGSAVTEEYSIEGASVGDIDISTATIVDFVGWIRAKALTNETASLILVGGTSNALLTSTTGDFLKVAGSTTYPAGNTDIGLTTTNTVTTVSLFECGIMVAYIPAAASTFHANPSVFGIAVN